MIARKVIHAARIRESFLTALMTVATGLILPVANSAQGTSTVPRTTATAVTSSRDSSFRMRSAFRTVLLASFALLGEAQD